MDDHRLSSLNPLRLPLMALTLFAEPSLLPSDLHKCNAHLLLYDYTNISTEIIILVKHAEMASVTAIPFTAI